MKRIKQFMVLDGIGNPLARKSDEANPFIFYNLVEAVKFAKEEIGSKEEVNNYAISIVELDYLETITNK